MGKGLFLAQMKPTLACETIVPLHFHVTSIKLYDQDNNIKGKAMKNSENKIIRRSGMCENEIGPEVLQPSVRKT